MSFLHKSPFCQSRFVITVRNPLDIITSMLAVSELEPTREAVGETVELLAPQGMSDAVQFASKQGSSLILKYEEFYNNFDFLFEQLERFLGAQIDKEARKTFEANFSIEAVKKRAERLGGFDKFDSEDQIHGRHISRNSGKPAQHLALLDQPSIQLIRERFSEFFHQFGY